MPQTKITGLCKDKSAVKETDMQKHAKAISENNKSRLSKIKSQKEERNFFELILEEKQGFYTTPLHPIRANLLKKRRALLLAGVAPMILAIAAAMAPLWGETYLISIFMPVWLLRAAISYFSLIYFYNSKLRALESTDNHQELKVLETSVTGELKDDQEKISSTHKSTQLPILSAATDRSIWQSNCRGITSFIIAIQLLALITGASILIIINLVQVDGLTLLYSLISCALLIFTSSIEAAMLQLVPKDEFWNLLLEGEFNEIRLVCQEVAKEIAGAHSEESNVVSFFNASEQLCYYKIYQPLIKELYKKLKTEEEVEKVLHCIFRGLAKVEDLAHHEILRNRAIRSSRVDAWWSCGPLWGPFYISAQDAVIALQTELRSFIILGKFKSLMPKLCEVVGDYHAAGSEEMNQVGELILKLEQEIKLTAEDIERLNSPYTEQAAEKLEAIVLAYKEITKQLPSEGPHKECQDYSYYESCIDFNDRLYKKLQSEEGVIKVLEFISQDLGQIEGLVIKFIKKPRSTSSQNEVSYPRDIGGESYQYYAIIKFKDFVELLFKFIEQWNPNETSTSKPSDGAASPDKNRAEVLIGYLQELTNIMKRKMERLGNSQALQENAQASDSSLHIGKRTRIPVPGALLSEGGEAESCFGDPPPLFLVKHGEDLGIS